MKTEEEMAKKDFIFKSPQGLKLGVQENSTKCDQNPKSSWSLSRQQYSRIEEEEDLLYRGISSTKRDGSKNGLTRLKIALTSLYQA
jgi:hypothetical protein